MSTALDPLKFDAIETSICQTAGLHKSIAPYASALDVISMKVIDLADDFRTEKKEFHHLAEKACRIFFENQLHIEYSSAFCSRSALTMEFAAKPIESLKKARVFLKGLKETGSVTCTKTCDVLAKLYFLTESRLKKTPYDHLLRPLDFEELNYDLIDEKSVARYIMHLQHYHHESSQILNITCPLIDEFLSSSILFDPDPIITKLEPLEEAFRSFLWRSKIYQKQVSSSVALLPSRDMDKVLKTCRYLHIFNHKVMGIAASIDRIRKKIAGVDPSFFRVVIHNEALERCHLYIRLLDKCYKVIFAKLDEIRSNPRYPSFIKEFDQAFVEVASYLASATKHHDESMLDYLAEKCESFKAMPAHIELYFEGYFFDKELAEFEVGFKTDRFSQAFFKLYEQCLSSLPSDDQAHKLKQDLEKILPFCRVLMCCLKTLKPVFYQLLEDAFYPKEVLDKSLIIDLLKQESDKFNLLPLEGAETSKDVTPLEYYLVDPYIKQAFEHVLASEET
jgi:hypothetical protein